MYYGGRSLTKISLFLNWYMPIYPKSSSYCPNIISYFYCNSVDIATPLMDLRHLEYPEIWKEWWLYHDNTATQVPGPCNKIFFFWRREAQVGKRNTLSLQSLGEDSLEEVWQFNLFIKVIKSSKRAYSQPKVSQNYLEIYLKLL